MTKKASRFSSLTRLPSAFRRMSSASLVKPYLVRTALIAAYGYLIPWEIASADSGLLASIWVGYAIIEMAIMQMVMNDSKAETHCATCELVFALTLWVSALWLTVFAFSHIVLSGALVLYYKPITYALEAVLLAALIMETRACSEQKPAF